MRRTLPDPDPGAGAAAADYIAEVTAELSALSRRHGLPLLAYILDMARLEAEARTVEGLSGGTEFGTERH